MQRKICPTCNIGYPARMEHCPEDGTVLVAKSGEPAPWTAGKLVGGKYVVFAQTRSNEVTSSYRVRRLDIDEVRSLRVLQPAFSADRAAAQEFRRAARLLRRLHHPNLVAVESLGDAEDGTPFLVTEIVTGPSLEELIGAEAPLSVRRACGIARQIAAGLDAAHRRGILHLGLRPSVIFISGSPEEEQVKLEDFGAAYARLSQTSNGHRHSGKTLRDLIPLNVLYASPEQAAGRHSEGLDARSDIYSLGVITFEMLTGRLPFPAVVSGDDSGAQVELASLVAHFEEDVPLQTTEELDVPQPLATLLAQLLQNRRELRPPTARQVFDRLGLIQDWIAARALIGVRSESAAPVQESIIPQPAEALSLVPQIEETTPAAPVSPPLPRPVEIDVLTPAGSGSTSELIPIVELEPAVPSVAETALVPAIAVTDRHDSATNSALFKTVPAPASRRVGWGRWVLAVLVLMLVAFGAFLAITHRLAPGPGPLSPVKPDEAQNAEGTSSSSTDRKSASDRTPPSSATTAQPQSGAPSAQEPATAVTPPAPSETTGAAAAAPKRPALHETAAQIDQAINAGDVFFEQGKYDLAIEAYSRPLKSDPGNKRLRARIDRARRAKTAEEQYLGQP